MRHSDLSDKAMRRILGTLCVLVALAITALGYLIGTTVQNASTRHLRAEAILTCRRLNVTRSTDNQAHLQSYQLYQFLLHASKAAEAKDPRIEQQAISRLQHGQQAATWTPLINCTGPHEALRSLSLQPVPFARRFPPASALNFVNAARRDPTGSVS